MALEGTLAGMTVVGFAGQVFSGCLKMYDIVSGARHFGEDTDMLFWNLQAQRVIFRLWGRYWTSGDYGALGLDRVLGLQGEEFRQVILALLARIQQSLCEAVRTWEKYGLRPSEKRPADFLPVTEVDPVLSAEEIQQAVSFWGRCRWQIKSKEKFTCLVNDLTTYNRNLQELLPRPTQQILALAATCQLVDAADGTELQAVIDAAQRPSENPDHAKYSRGAHDLADVKRYISLLMKNGDNKQGSAKSLSLARPENWFFQASAPNRSPIKTAAQLEDGIFLGKPVIIEWKKYDGTLDFPRRMTIYNRVDSLVRFLSVEKPEGFRVPKCIAYIHREDAPKFGLIYDIPDLCTADGATGWTTLHQVLDKHTPAISDRASLESRYRLASVLASSLMQLHAAGWLHKGIRSASILLLPLQQGDTGTPKEQRKAPPLSPSPLLDHRYDFSRPFILGFGYSRPDSMDEITLERSNNRLKTDDHDLYRHPDLIPTSSSYKQAPRFRREYDFFAFGLVLLEIALQKPLAYLRKPQDTPEGFLDRLKRAYIPQIAPCMGSAYQDCVLYCLSAADEKEPLAESFGAQYVLSTREPAPAEGESVRTAGVDRGTTTATIDSGDHGAHIAAREQYTELCLRHERDLRLQTLTNFFWNVVVPLGRLDQAQEFHR